jgi:hypothetical protein
MTSSELRHKLRIFDTFFHKVSSRALLKDRVYDPSKPFEADFAEAMTTLSTLSYVPEEFDCDDFAEAACALIKIANLQRGTTGKAYPVFPCALKENHTIVIFVGDTIRFGEPQTGQTWGIDESKPNVIFVG